MRGTAKWISAVFVIFYSVVALAAPAKVLRTFTFRITGEPETLDWNLAHTPVETNILMNVMEGLVSFDSNMKVVPALARSWELSSDSRTYTFKLRTDVQWSDGIALKAQDFVYSWKRLLSPITAASYAYFLFDIEGAELFNSGKLQDFSGVGVKALDDYTLQVKLTRPVAHWLYIPTFWVTFPLREDVVKKYGNTWDKPGRMVNLGPFSLDSIEVDSKIVLKANPKYYGSRGNLEAVVAQVVTDDATALNLYETGKFDFLTELSTLDLKRLSGRADLKTFPYLKLGYLGFSVDKYPMSNLKFRRAVAMAIEKSRIPQILHGGQQPATSFVPPKLLAHSRDAGLKFDPFLAKSELKASGFEMGKSPKLELLTLNWDKPLFVAEFIQSELKKNLGLDVILQPFDHKTFRAKLDLHAFPLFEASWAADFPDPDNFLSVFLSNSGNNRTKWSNAKYDELVLGARNMTDSKAREKAYREAERILLAEEAVVVPLYYEPNMALVRARVRGLELNPLNYLYLRKVSVSDGK